ncbi:MAG: flagellar basal body L-ring protein FlgH [Limnochordaceae bacterium]|nr:flagellar basal body L-ring protein FlgH [Limnochordaceae bacterium]
MPGKGWLARIGCALILWLVAVGAACFPARAAGSLWAQTGDSGGGPPVAGWFADHKASRVGDLLTLVVVEQTQAVQEAKSAGNESSGFSVGGSGLLARYIPLFGFTGQDKTEGAGTTSRSGSLTARLTVKVIEVLPEGLLRVQGEQRITVNGEEQELVVSGLVRREDIQPDNSVLSTHLADARITVKGNGTLGKQAEPGLLTKLFNWLF